MLSFLLRSIAVLAALGVLTVFAWPQLLGLQNADIVAHAVSLRGLAVVVAVALLGLLTVVFLLARSMRGTIGVLMMALLLFGAVNVGVLVNRGLGFETATAAAADAGAADAVTADAATTAEVPGDGGASITVLSWNTLGDAPGAEAIAALAVDEGADVVTLPETTEDTGVLVAEAMRAAGRPMWVHTVAFDLVSKARSTTLLISPDLGDYAVTSAPESGAPGNTAVLPSVVAVPVDGTGPTIVAVHAVAPIQRQMDNWRDDLDWLAGQCSGTDVIMAGDFNATLDHLGQGVSETGAALGRCRDAALQAGTAGVGTWPAWAPSLLGSPIDHVLATSNWKVDSVRVIESEDDSGSDHRPLVATLTAPAG